MVIVLLANGFEELEAITPVDVLRRNNIDVRTVSITNEKLITGTHGIQVSADLIASDVPLDSIDMLILPGGMPGVKNLDASPITKIFIDSTLKNGGRLAAICAAPSIFGKHGMLTNIRATCFPGFEGDMLNAILVDADVVTDGVFTTAKDYKAASAFADELVRVCDKLGIKPHEEGEGTEGEEEEVIDLSKLFEFDFEDVISSDDEFFIENPIVQNETKESEDDQTVYDVDTADGDVMAEIERDKAIILDLYETIFNHHISIRRISRGPRFTRYEIVPTKGTRASSITRAYDDLVLALAKEGVRMQAPIPGKSAIGIEVPNDTPKLVTFHDMKQCKEYSGAKTTVPIGMDVAGEPVFFDVTSFPHALVCGATGMGKSVFINTLLTSLIDKNTPEELKLILIDPKRVEFSNYKDIPHLLTPILFDAKESAGALMWAQDEMERRYDRLEKLGVRNIKAYNEKVAANPEAGEPMPVIVIVIDELADLMLQVREPVENYIMRLAQKSRASGIHMIIATQRPSVNVITALIKANIPTRICFKLTSTVDSRTVLDVAGGEKLCNKGDMLFHSPFSMHPTRVQAAFISDTEIEAFNDKLREKGADYDSAVTEDIKQKAQQIRDSINSAWRKNEEEDSSYLNDDLFLEAVELAIISGKISTSLLQRKLSIGYGKAAKFVDAMEELGIVSEPRGQKPRDVLITMEEWQDKLARLCED